MPIRFAIAAAFALLFTVPVSAAAAPVTFRFVPPAGADRVNLAGTFNGWSVEATPLADADGDGVYEARIELEEGRHLYKFVVNGTEWITDEAAEDFVDDGFGGRNSVLTVGREPLTVNGSLTAGEGGASGSPRETLVRFRFRAPEGASLVTVAGTFNEWSPGASALDDVDRDGVWEGTLRLAHGTYQYKFVANGTDWFTDEHAAAFADDGFGGRNSVVEIGAEPAVVGEPLDGANGGPRVAVRFRYRPEAAVNAVSVAGSFNGWDAGAHVLRDENGDGIWEIEVALPHGEHRYQFVENGERWVGDPFASDVEPDGFGGENARFTLLEEPLSVGVPR